MTAKAESRAGHGHVSLIYQYITADSFDSTIGEIQIGPVDTHTLHFEIEYYLNEKLTLVAGIPFVRKRCIGTAQHDRLVKHIYVNVGVGLDWAFNENYQLSTAVITMSHAEIVHIMDYGLSAGIFWSF